MDQFFTVTPSRAERLRLLRHMLQTADQALDKVLKRGDIRPAAELDHALGEIETMLWVMRVTGDYEDSIPFPTSRWLSRLASGQLQYQRPGAWWKRTAERHEFPYDGMVMRLIDGVEIDERWNTENP